MNLNNKIVLSVYWSYSCGSGECYMWGVPGPNPANALTVMKLGTNFTDEVCSYFKKNLQKEVVKFKMDFVGEFICVKVDFIDDNGQFLIQQSQAVYTKNTQAVTLTKHYLMVVSGLVKWLQKQDCNSPIDVASKIL